MEPKIASLSSSMIGTHGFRGDLIAITMPASVCALLLVSASNMAAAQGSVDSADSRNKQ